MTYINNTCNGTTFLVTALWGPGEGPNGQISLNFNYYVNFKYFLNQTFVCRLTNERYKNILEEIFIRSPGSCPRGDAGGQNFNFLTMVMWHTKLKGMIYHEEFYHMIKLATLGRGKRSNIIRFLRENGDSRWRAIV